MDIHALENVIVKPLARFGFTHRFWNVHLDTLISTWVCMALLVVFTVFARRSLSNPRSILANLMEKVVGFFANTITEAFGQPNFDCTGFVIGIFFFTLACNVCGVLIFLKEATLDLNTTLAIAAISFFYVQYQGVITKKKAYFAKFLQPIFVFLPVNVTGQLAKLASLNFRLFGNILAGAIIWGLMYQILVRIHWLFCIAGLIILPLALIFEKFAPDRGLGKAKQAVRLLIRFIQLIPAVLIVFGVIEGILQAFVIALLTSMYISGEVDTTTSH